MEKVERGCQPTSVSESAIVILQSKFLLTKNDNSEFIFPVESLLSLGTTVLRQYSLGENPVIVEVTDDSCAEGFEWRDLRQILSSVEPSLFKVASKTIQYSRWLTDHTYCGRCGQKTLLDSMEPRLYCECCKLDVYPRISPCVIGLIQKGDQCLLARGERHPDIFSTLAGFIEPGETPEEAFAREVAEEVGVSITNIRYVGAQTWPFPSQLMLGYTADYKHGDLIIDEKEILEAGWFDVDNLPSIPSERTIAGQLIRAFVKSKARH